MKKHNWELMKQRATAALKEMEARSQDKKIPSKVYTDLLLVEKAIHDSGAAHWVGSGRGASPWQILVENIICYNNFHSYKNEKTFGKQYLDRALEHYDLVYRHYTSASTPHEELKKSLDTLLASIHQEIKECEKKLQNGM